MINSAQTVWHSNKLICRLALTVGLISGALPSTAPAAWPADQPINMIIAYAPGGGTDIIEIGRAHV